MNLIESALDRSMVIERENELDVLGILNKFGTICDYMTEQMVTQFYNVGNTTIKLLATRNKSELEKYGYRTYSKQEILKLQDVTLENIPNRGLRLYPIKAVMIVGMLLTESKIAEQFRKNIIDKITGQDIQQKKAMALLKAVETTGEESIIAIKQYTNLKIEEETKPLIDIIDNVLSDDHLYDIGNIGKTLKPYNKEYFGAKKIFDYLRNEKILMNKPKTQKHNMPYDKYSDYFVIKPITVHNDNLDIQTNKTYFTGKGVKWLLKFVAKKGLINSRDKDDIINKISNEI